MGAAAWMQVMLEIGLALVRAVPDAIDAVKAHHTAIKAVDPGRRKAIDDAIDAELERKAKADAAG